MTRSIPLWRFLLRYDVFSFPWRVRSWFLRYSFVSIYRRKSQARKQRPRRRSGRKSPSFWPRIRRGVRQLGSGAGDPWHEARCAGIGRKDVLRSRVCCGHDSNWCNLATDWWRGSLSQTDSRLRRLSLFDLESTGNLDRPVLWWAVRQRTSGSNSNCVHVCCSKICISDETWPQMHPGIRYHGCQTAL